MYNTQVYLNIIYKFICIPKYTSETENTEMYTLYMSKSVYTKTGKTKHTKIAQKFIKLRMILGGSAFDQLI